MPPYTLYFEWMEGGPIGDTSPYPLDFETLEQSKVRAAILYAGATFMRVPPTAYRIEDGSGRSVYRFPERRPDLH